MASAGDEGATVGATVGAAVAMQQKRKWMKYYCEACEAWETREMFEVAKLPAALWSWGCTKLVRHATLQTFRVEELNSADGRDAAPALDFPATESPASTQPVAQPTEVSAHAASQSNGSAQSKLPKRNVRSAYARDSVTEATSPVHSQGGVTSSSPDEVAADENGASKDSPEATKQSQAAAADASVPDSPAVIDAEHHDNGVHKRPRRLTAGDRYLAQALQYEKPARVTTKPLAEVSDVKPSQSSFEIKRPKRVTAGLRGAMLSAENSKSHPSPRVLAKKEQKKDTVHEVRNRSETAKKPSKKNRKLGDLY